MKLQSTILLENLTIKELELLTSEVKETLACNCKKGKNRIFSAAQYWDIQRRRKNRFRMRTYF
ncbi:MAG: hypothetical protein ABI359_15660 [Ginsengibacter sp.]